MPPNRYYIDNKRVPGVTTVLKQWGSSSETLFNWGVDLALSGTDPRKVRDRAAKIGTTVHLLLGSYLSGSIPKRFTSKEARTAYGAWKKWYTLNRVQMFCSEQSIVSTQFRFGGTLDLVVYSGLGLGLIDIKTSGQLYDTHRVQVSAYNHLWKENFPDRGPFESVLLLRLDKESGDFEEEYLTTKTLEYGWEAFLACLKLYQLQKDLK